MSDIRIKYGLIGHPKLEKLKLLIGDQALERLVTLWIRVAQNKPKGNLKGLDEIDIALYAGYKDDPAFFVDALKKCRFLIDNGNGLEIQDWKEHQPWAYYSKERSEKARQAACIRWGTDGDAESMRGACETHKESNAPSPTPTPNPNPKDNLGDFKFEKAVKIPSTIFLTKKMIDYAKEQGCEDNAHIEFMFKSFKNWFLSTGKKYQDWTRTFYNWVLKDKKEKNPSKYEKWIPVE